MYTQWYFKTSVSEILSIVPCYTVGRSHASNHNINFQNVLNVIFQYLGEAVFGQCDELLFSRGTDVESNRQQTLQSSNDQTRLHRVSISLPLHLLPLLV